ncbi:MAG: hypothetical protein JW931_06190 [Methanomicrobiaceae archaeon]|nr:hypothetical protein [Methanomicrobiaceae archaeon]
MPHEKIISGDLDGDGVEGHRKKITGGEFPRKDKDEHDLGLETSESRQSPPEKSKVSDSGDLFYTGFGSAKPKGSDLPKKKSVIGGDSDIFETGFGSATQHRMEKMVHATGSTGKRPEERPGLGKKPERSPERRSFFTDDEADELFEGKTPGVSKKEPEKGSIKKKGSRLDEDPFYTGFGYTDQRGKDSPADGGLFPDSGQLPEMPDRELLPDRGERAASEEVEHEMEIPEEKPKNEEKAKRPSVLTRDDDDLFS